MTFNHQELSGRSVGRGMEVGNGGGEWRWRMEVGNGGGEWMWGIEV